MAIPIWTEQQPGIDEWTAETAADFIAALRRSNDHWWEGSRMPWVFRGHADESWPLLPSAWRQTNKIIEAGRKDAASRFDRVKPDQKLRWWFGNFVTGETTFRENDVALARQLSIETTAELLPIHDFLLVCNNLGLAIPVPHLPADPSASPDWLIGGGGEPLTQDDFIRYSDIPMELALAQHHGLPTRLLDWTLDPVSAAFFAVEAVRDSEPKHDIAVWALHRSRAETVTCGGVNFPNGPHGAPKITSGIWILHPPIRDNPYLAAQSGLFTSISGSGIYFMENGGKRPSLDQFIAESDGAKSVLRKMVLSRDQIANLAEILEREQVSRSRLMPTLDNAAADVMRRWLQGIHLDDIG